MSSLQSPDQNVLGKTDDIPNVMSVESTTLEPITITDTQARWVLLNQGTLSRDSVLQFQMTVEDANDKLGYLPISAGIYSLIKTAVLKIGGKRINSIQDLALFKVMTKSYDTPSYRTNRTRILEGINTALIPINSAPTSASGGRFCLAGSNLVNEGEQVQDYQMALRSTKENTPCWSVRLVELFPILYDIELPLHLLNNEVSIDLTFRTQVATDTPFAGVGTLCCFESKVGNAMRLGTCSLVKESCLLYLDTIYYSNERMELNAEKVNARDGFTLDYVDVIQNVSFHKQADTITVAGESNMVVNSSVDQVPLSGFRVKNLFFGYNIPDGASLRDPLNAPTDYRYFNEFVGKYMLNSYAEDDTWDLRVNDELKFPQPVKSATLKASEAECVYGSPVWLNQALYSKNAVSTKPNTSTPSTNLFPIDDKNELLPNASQYKCWGGYNNLQYLNGNISFSAINCGDEYGNANDDFVLIGQKPIEVLHSSLPVNSSTNQNRNCYYYSEVVKRFGVQNGQAVVFQQPAVPVGVTSMVGN